MGISISQSSVMPAFVSGSYYCRRTFLGNLISAALLMSTARPEFVSQTKRIEIKFNENGEGTLIAHGLGEFPCLGKPGLSYPKDVTVTPKEKERLHISKEFDGAEMPFAIRIWGQRGIYIHEGDPTLAANGGPSQGCIHLKKGDAQKVYDWVTGPTRVTIEYKWKAGK
jgi:hypothetical protein